MVLVSRNEDFKEVDVFFAVNEGPVHNALELLDLVSDSARPDDLMLDDKNPFGAAPKELVKTEAEGETAE